MKKTTTALLIVTAVSFAFMPLGCGGGSHASHATAKLTPPTVYDTTLALQYNQLGSNGYAMLQAKNYDSAIVLFKAQAALIPDGKWAQYNIACVYGRQGDVANGMAWLDSALAHGWADPDQLAGDADIASLHADSGFASLVDKARAVRTEKYRMFAAGLPRYDKPPKQFASVDELSKWVGEQNRIMSIDSRVWHTWEQVAFGLDLEAKRLAAMKVLKGDSFDVDLERIKSLARMASPYDERWGVLSEAIMNDADAYLAKHPSGESASEAAYHGLAAALKQYPADSATTPTGQKAMTKAAAYMTKIDQSSDRYQSGEVWMMSGKLAAAGDNRDQLYPSLKELQASIPDTSHAAQLERALLSEDLVRANWPIAINAVDIDGKPVSLDDYKGKVVMVDFWATWCGPCRAELPYVKSVYQKYHKDGFDILSISLDYPQRTDTAKYRKWVEDNGMNWRHVYDGKNWESPITTSYFVGSIPSPFLIDRNGKLVAMHDECRGENLEKVVRKALGLQPI